MPKVADRYTVATVEDTDCVVVADAADFLGCTVYNVHALINSRHKRLEAKEFGSQLLVTVASLEAEKTRRDEIAEQKAQKAVAS